MRRNILIAALLLAALNGRSSAQDKGVGLGVVLGEPTGFSAKLWTSHANAMQFGAGWVGFGSKGSGGRIHVTGDYLWHSFDFIRASERFPVYFGVGGALSSGGDLSGSVGVRGVFGVDWMSRSIPIDVFLEVVPVFQVTPSTSLYLDAGLGVRYFFD